jgi:hypothetical protein
MYAFWTILYALLEHLLVTVCAYLSRLLADAIALFVPVFLSTVPLSHRLLFE